MTNHEYKPGAISWEGEELTDVDDIGLKSIREYEAKLARDKYDALYRMSTADQSLAGAAHPHSILQGGVAGAYASAYTQKPKGTPKPLAEHTSEQLVAMIRQRMRVEWVPLDFITCFCNSSDKVRVFVCHKDQAVIIEDDANFPSDKLMGQLRLILG